jgi:hypothetical protein
MMEHNTILYPTERISSNPVLAVLKETGCEVVSTNAQQAGSPCSTSCEQSLLSCSTTGRGNRPALTWHTA